ncbi:PREDICTED: uncharacterized protein LOC102854709 [Elephantulus edwardii]|uniref:uncharacterized protein LOC102854709 n=1 Tax=Elephantulus edwardii TaxID=28737 RepID=UPI0003F0D8C3|nr:PREDICTED: uncharacterized protein LOC102854709 [Elephantulus edwardii]
MVDRLQRTDRSGLVLLCIFLVTLRESQAGQIRYSVPEETDKGSFVGNISKDLGLEPRELAERGVRIVSRGRTQLFALSARSGSLVTAGRIDREELCETISVCLLNMEVLVEDTLKIYGVEVEITDINDNAPSFREEEVEIKVSEHATPGWGVPLPSAKDPDVGANALQSYQLSPNNYFSLHMRGGSDGAKNPELVLEQTLDREKEAVHLLRLTAVDGGDPIRKGSVPIRVLVLDVNDHTPKFTQSVYRVSVPENRSSGTRVLGVNATDPDEGANGEVMYSFRNVEDKAAEIFQLDSRTGEVLLRGSLDYEKYRFYEMEIQGQDGGGLLTTAKLLITVLDVNDNPPEITIASSTNSVQENAPPGTVIALVNVQDQDSGENGQVSCFISENLPFKLEKTYGNYYRLITDRALDREQVDSYTITLTATDQGRPPLATETHLSLSVADANDNPPTFLHTAYSAHVPENNPRGSSIFSLTAHDPDSKENARVIYSLAEDTIQGSPLSSYVSINSDTGVLYALRSFDYEQFRDLQLWVTASDSGNPPLSSNVSLSLFVLDQNDNVPEILYPAFPTDGSTGVELAPRSAEPGYLVTKVVAVDRDSGQNAWLSYRLLKASEPGLFAVGVHTGEVRTARALQDRDALKQSLVVAVQDHGQPPLSATVTLTVAIADSIPDVLADLGSLEAPANPEDSGLTLYLVVAVTAVSCVFLAFVIVLMALRLRRWHTSRLLQASRGGLAGVPGTHFVGVDGVRTFLQTYSHEVSLTADSRKSHLIFPQPNYADTLISQDSCEKSEPLLIAEDSAAGLGNQVRFNALSPCWCLRTSLLTFILILMGDDAKQRNRIQRPQVLFPFLLPLLCPALSGQVRYSIPEEMARGSVVGNLAEDLGLHVQDLLTRNLRVSAEKQYFTVSTENGNILVADRIDRESLCPQKPLCVLPLEIVAENPLNMFHVSVIIEDINDNPPRFTHDSIVLQINEFAIRGSRFGLESAIDADVGRNSLQSYLLSSNEHFSLMVKDKTKGKNAPELVLEKPLDREQQSSHLLVLTALDGGDPVLMGTTQIRIQVTDANDNPPVFSQDEYRVTLVENVPLGTSVLTVRATDQDEGVNAEITYSFRTLRDDTGNTFMLDHKSGEIKSRDLIDFEVCSSYTMSIEAKDGGGMAAECKIIVDILDENDNAPDVVFTSVASSITEDAEPGTVIALFKTHDKDSGENGEIICVIKEDVPFRIESSVNNYYKLVTEGALDREQTPEYNITIVATDKGKPPLSSSTSITLYIADVNDNAPAFPQASYVVHVLENNSPGASIAQVSATDLDSGPNSQISYSIVASDLEPRALSSYVSVSAHSGVVFAQRAFDHEQLRAFQLTLQARDQGSPSLSANVSLRVLVGDRNDNAPRVLYPVLGLDGSALFDTVPRAAQPGYLVTKVVAVDADSGHNAWLSYHVLQASEPGLFNVGLRTGEVRTARVLGDRDAARHRLLVSICDGGQPPLSATATLLLVFADSLQEALPDLSERPVSSDPQAELQFYLVLALALISVLFLLAVILAIALRLRRSSNQATWNCFQPGFCSKSVVPPNYTEGTLPYSYNLYVAQTGKTELNILKCNEQLNSGEDIICGDSSGPIFPLCGSSESTSHPETLTLVSFISTFIFPFYCLPHFSAP